MKTTLHPTLSRRPQSLCLSRSSTPLALTHTHPLLPHQQQRHESTARRQRRALNLPPAPFLSGPFLPKGSSGRSRTHQTPPPLGDHIIFTPPPSAPNVYHTPLKFLPRGDVRRSLFETHPGPLARSRELELTAATTTSFASSLTGGNSSKTAPLPPPIRPPYSKQYHLLPADIAEMRSLRQSDESKWTRSKLAERFQCSQLFVGMVVQAGGERLKAVESMRKEVRDKWGVRRRKAREESGRRREAWGRDE